MIFRPFLCIGHRGAKGHAPENTLASIRKALDLGAHCVEIDVHMVDGELVVIHDERLERRTNGFGSIHDYKFHDLRSLDAGESEIIPTLREIFQTLNHRAGVNIELKGAGTAEPVARLISDKLSKGWNQDHILVSSFSQAELTRFHELMPDIKIGRLVQSTSLLQRIENELSDCFSLHVSADLVSVRLITAVHAQNKRIYVFTVNEPNEIFRLRTMGVDGVFTDYPDRVFRVTDATRSSLWWA
ncbi:MAG: glycerophosphodiester phosphodiesterase [FCB group bacterium]|nr:glycerophosphodiester phosphodiesterase [FCB group bacterium]